MRYKLDAAGYVCAVSFGCYLDNCTEYTGAVPAGYNNLDEWASYACIQAYYIDNGNLMLDAERLAECKEKEEQEAIDNAPLLKKDLYETDTVLDSQYIKATETGQVIVLEDIKTITPRVKITGIDPHTSQKVSVYTHGKQMMPCSAATQNIAGVSFTKHTNGAITAKGTATSNIEYTVSGSSNNAIPLFMLKAKHDYYLNLGGFDCELKLFDGETTAQQYVGASGLLNLSQSIEVTEVILKIPKGKQVDVTFYPQLEYGNAFTSYAEHKRKVLHIDFSEQYPAWLYPDETLYPSDTLYVGQPTETVDYILIEGGLVYVSVDGVEKMAGAGSVGLYSSYNTIYASHDTTLEIEYSTKIYDVDSLEFLQGKATTTNKFKILKDGSIEAHNGYFSGRIEADSGYFKGEISWEQITGNEDVATKTYVEDKDYTTMTAVEGKGYTTMTAVEAKGYQDAIQVTKITKDTVTAPFIKTLGLTVGNEILMGENATISWANVTNQPTIPTNTNQLENGAGYTTMTEVEGKGYQTAIQVTKITKDTVTAPFIKTLGLTVGNEILMGENATISWEKVTNQPTIPTNTNQLINGAGYTTMSAVEGKGYQNASQVTKITKDTVTTSYVNALNVKAGSVDAENITGTTITGKAFKGGSISIGNNFSVDTSGNLVASSAKITGNGSVEFEYLSTKMSLSYDAIKFGATSWNTEITKDKVQVHDNYIDQTKGHFGSTTLYTEIADANVKVYSGYNKFIEITPLKMTLGSGSKYTITKGSTDVMTFDSNFTAMYATYTYLGNSSGYLGFFGSGTAATSAKKQTVAAVSTSASASTIAAKVNELITALQAYNLIG